MAAIDHVGIYVSDLERSIRFYQEIFGFPLHKRLRVGDVQAAFLDVKGTYLEVVEKPGEPKGAPAGAWSHIAFYVDDFDGMVSKLEGMGLKLERITLPDGTRIVFFKDPDGHDVEIDERKVAQ